MKNFVLPDKVYQVFKWLLMTLVPATTTLIGGLGVLYNYDTTKIIALIGLVATFIGSLVGISYVNYTKGDSNNAKFNQ